MNAKAALKEAQSKVAALIRQRQALEKRMSELQQSAESDRQAIQKADAALDEAIRAELRGLVTQADVDTAKATLASVQARYAAHERSYRLARQESAKLEMEVMTAEHLERAALAESKQALIDPLEARIRNDSKLRGELLAIYGLYSAKAGGRHADWGLVLADIFPAPTETEHRDAIEAAVARLDQD